MRADGTSTFTLDPKVFPSLASDVQRVAIGSPFTLTLDGNPGGYQVLHMSARTGPTTTFPRVDGALVLDRNNLHHVAFQVLPPSGTLELPFQVPNAPGLLGLTLYFQAAERLPPQFERQTHAMPSRFAIGNPLLLPITE